MEPTPKPVPDQLFSPPGHELDLPPPALARLRSRLVESVRTLFMSDFSTDPTVDIPSDLPAATVILRYYGRDQYRLWKRLNNPKVIPIVGSPEASPVSPDRARGLHPSIVAAE